MMPLVVCEVLTAVYNREVWWITCLLWQRGSTTVNVSVCEHLFCHASASTRYIEMTQYYKIVMNSRSDVSVVLINRYAWSRAHVISVFDRKW